MKLEALPLSEMRTHCSEKWRGFDADVLPLPVAEMDYPIAKPIQDLLIKMVSKSDLGYLGKIPELGHAFAAFAKRRWDWEVVPDYVRLCTDVGVGMVEVLRSLIAPGDKVLVNSPIYQNFYNWINETHAQLVDVPMLHESNTWEFDYAGIEQKYAEGVKIHAICNPHNPLGRVFTKEELSKIATLAEKYNVQVVSDEIHAPLTFKGQKFIPYLTVDNNGICVTSASKGWNIAGLKSAMIVTQNKERHELMGKMPISVHYRSSILGAFAAVAAFNEGEPWLDSCVEAIETNAHYLKNLLDTQLPSVKYQIPQCSYLAWIDVSSLNLGENPSEVFLNKGKVAFNAGKIYGAQTSQYVRMNMATSESVISEAVNRMVKSL